MKPIPSHLLLACAALALSAACSGALAAGRNPLSVHVLNLQDGKFRKLSSDLLPAGWSPDGRHIYAYAGGDPAGKGAREIVAFPLEGGDSRRVGELPFEPGAVHVQKVVHVPGPDLRFVCEVAQTSVDLWMVNEFEV